MSEYRPFNPTDGWMHGYLLRQGVEPEGSKTMRYWKYLEVVANERGLPGRQKGEKAEQMAYRIGLRPKESEWKKTKDR